MKSKSLFIIIVSCIVSIISFLGYKTYKFQNIKKITAEKIKRLPALHFKFKSFDTTTIEGKFVIVNYFSPDCEHCLYMISNILENRNAFQRAHIFMITPAKESEVTDFINKNRLDSINFITIGIDTSFSFFQTFGSSLIPSFYIYNAQHELDTVFKGETKIENLIIRIQ